MFLQISMLLLVIWPSIASNENCEEIEELKPFDETYNCTSNGFFPDETDHNCTKYIVCARSSSRPFITLYLTCPEGTKFDPAVNDCTSQYTCPYRPITNTSVCIYNADPNYFTCDTSGTFVNLNDPTCQSYYHCLFLYSSNLFLQSRYVCSQNHYYNPDIKRCDKNYICPCYVNTGTIPSTNINSTTVESNSNQRISTIIPITTEDYISTSNFFTTTAFSTKESTGLELSTKYITSITKEPSSSTADHHTSVSTTKYITSISTTEGTTNSSFMKDTTPNVYITSTVKDVTDISILTTAENCIYNDDPEYFTCSVSGRFRNNHDRKCKSYYLCSVLKSGRIIQTKYSCPEKSYFNPSKHICDVNYKCPCLTVTSTTASSTTTKTSDEGNQTEISTTTEITSRTATTEKTTDEENISSTIDQQSTTSINSSSATEETTTDKYPISNSTSSTAISTEKSTSTTAENCIYNDNPEYFTCSVSGRFRNNHDRKCQSYYLCSILKSGRIIQTKYSCPEKSYFNPSKHICDVNYKCPCSTVTSTTTKTSDEGNQTEKSTTEKSTTEITSRTATTEKTSDEENTSSTINQQSTTSINFSSATEETTTDKYPISDSTSSTATSTEKTTSTTAENCIYNDDPEYFTCSVSGRFRNNHDRKCKSYYLCSVFKSGRIIQTKYNCPENSYFNPLKHICDVNYKCPCSTVTSTTTSSTTTKTSDKGNQTEISTSTEITSRTATTEKTTDEENTSSTIDQHPTTSINSSSATEETTTDKYPISNSTSSTAISTEKSTSTTAENCIYNDNPEYFTCSVSGRFRNNHDRKCQSYYLCSILKSGRIIQTKYDCPENSYFNPLKHICDVNYKCPCSTVTITTTSSTTMKTSDEGNQTKISTTTEITSRTATTEENTSSTIDQQSTTSFNSSSATKETTTDKYPISNSTSSTAISTEKSTLTTAENCIYNDNPKYFTCSVSGRFRNNHDRKCKSYYLCSVLKSGRIIQTKYSCPEKSYFNPSKHICDVNYKCPCLTETSTTTSSTTTKTSDEGNQTEISTTTEITSRTATTEKTTDEENTSSTIDQQSTTSFNSSSATEETTTDKYPISDSTSSTAISTEKSTSTTAENCIYNDNPEYFTCSVSGRFRNNHDRKCKSYYLCSVLKSGRIIQTKYSCPEKSYFNPSKHICDVNYKCPCLTETSTTASSTTTKTSDEGNRTEISTTEITSRTATTEKTTDEENTSSTIDQQSTTSTKPSSATEETTTDKYPISDSTSSTATSTEKTTSTTAENCIYNDNPEYFTCSVSGRFRNNHDRKCKSYYLCSVLKSGRIIQTKYSCPEKSYFNPSKHICDVNYKCPCSTVTSTTTSSTTTKTSDEGNQTEISTTTEITSRTASTEKTTNEENVSSTIDQHSTTSTKPSSATEETTTDKYPISDSTSSTATSTEKTTSTTAENCIYNDNPEYFTCSVSGRFRNNHDRKCKSYYLCSVLKSGRIIQTKYSCPEKSYFNPSKHICDVNYKCPCSTVTSTTTSSTTTKTSDEGNQTEISTTTEITSRTASTEKTTDEENISSTIDQHPTTSTKPSSATEETTTDKYPISDSTSSTATSIEKTTSTTAENCIYNDNPEYFTCSVSGRFRNNHDRKCKSYYLCSVLKSGRIIQTKYSCPEKSYFNPSKHICDVNYKCPCSTVTSPTTSSTTTKTSDEGNQTEKSTTEMNDEETTTKRHTTESDGSTTSSTTETPTTAQICSSYNSDPDYLTCTVKGRFQNHNDINCTSYYLCSELKNGRFIKTKYTCPPKSYFNPAKQICDMDYKCECFM
ncbi:unnamed protein product [Psylliodes chrysocephalus]|uniref:Chitin-binding type-2 domain-containing protein n=1 Tax=Psylliodes chrysocephalus TaxID=3402493 RepID=A0A9P0GGY6_9CUCU|nr:unnamed protein product [Psylliodes chrysocephala]